MEYSVYHQCQSMRTAMRNSQKIHACLAGSLLSALLSALPVFSAVASEWPVAGNVTEKVSQSSRPEGKETARILTENYNRVVEDCGNGKPAYLCSGVTLRATSPKEGRFALDPSPASIESGGVSFSWLRKDQKLNQLVWKEGNGFITFNRSNTPSGIDNTLDYMCFFPEDAGSGSRLDKGCGAHKNFPDTSQQCQLQGIMTAEQWVEHFKKSSNLHNQCGFIISENQSEYNSVDGFYQGIRASIIERGSGLSGQNEFRIATWKTSKESGYPERFPVQSFFYINQSDLRWAQYDQAFFYNRTGLWIPIIKLTLPKSTADDAKFEYLYSDQNLSVKVPEATGDKGSKLTQKDYYRMNELGVDTVVHSGISEGDEVTLKWDAPRNHYETTKKATKQTDSLHFTVPRAEFIDAIGSRVKLSFQVKKAHQEEQMESEVTYLDVEGQHLQLPEPTFSTELRKITVRYSGMSVHDRISIRVEGINLQNSPLIPGKDSGEVTYIVPEEWLKENKGKEIYITYAVGNDKGEQYQFSQVLRLKTPDIKCLRFCE
ncbi:hypothetical protein [Erwinia typographi]|nr:hypothetical protein [Erwinia typographi]